jgi:hypothetical protein
MKHRILLVSALAFGAIAPLSAQTVVSRDVGSLSLIAGWDFNNGQATAASVNARYSDLYSPAQFTGSVSSPGSAAYGTLHFTTNGGTFVTEQFRNSTAGLFDIDRQILSRSSGTQLLGQQSGGDGSITAETTFGNPLDFVFAVSSATAFNNFENLSHNYYAANLRGSGSITVDWFYSTSNGGAKIATGLSNVITGSSFTNFTADFSSIDAMEGLDELYIVGRVSESASAASLAIDNVAIYGTAAAVPEPASFAALAGAACLGLAASRRRRRA